LKIDSGAPGGHQSEEEVRKRVDVEEDEVVLTDDAHLSIDSNRASPIEIQAANQSHLIPSEPTYVKNSFSFFVISFLVYYS